jgi:hypothetical protein
LRARQHGAAAGRRRDQRDVIFFPVNQLYTIPMNQAAEIARAVHPKVFYSSDDSDTKIEELEALPQRTRWIST